MKTSRRKFLQATATSAAAATTARALDPFEPAEPGLVAQWFDKGKQHVLPKWAFDGRQGTPGVSSEPARVIQFSPTPRPAATDTWQNLSGGATHNGSAPFLVRDGDKLPVGKVFHGTAVEWNGRLIGGNFRYDAAAKKWGPATGSAWASMFDRVTPEGPSPSWLITDTGNWGKFGTPGPDGAGSLVQCFRVEMFEGSKKLRPDAALPALAYTYGGMLPGPTFRFRHGMPAVVRFHNNLQTEVSIHHHGGHNPTHGDGFPSYYALQGEARDYLYPNILPLRYDGKTSKTEIDFGEGQSTTWYHDHGLDATAFNVSHGLSGFALWFDDLELRLIREGVLPGIGVISQTDDAGKRTVTNPSISGFDPELAAEKQTLADAWGKWKAKSPGSYWSKRHTLAASGQPDPDERRGLDEKRFYRETLTPYFNPYDLPIVLQDRVVDLRTGQIVYDSNGHNGYIGNTQLINAVPWPVCEVKSRKYRLRILDGSNARIYRLRFLDAATFGLRPNADGDLEPTSIPDATLEERSKEFLRIGKDSWLWPMPQKRKSFILNMANRADLIVDFKAWYQAAAKAGQLTAEGNAEFYLVNTMPQFDGRGPKSKLAEDAGDPNVFPLPFTLNPANPVVAAMSAAGVIPGTFFGGGPQGQATELNQPIGLIKFVISADEGEGEDAIIDETTILRPRHRIPDEDVMAVREFVFERGKGAWMINGRFYDPTISNASPVIGIKGQKFSVPSGDPGAVPKERESLEYAEEWILRNGGGGWWHPIHIHLEGHQLVGYEKDFVADGLVGPDGVLGVAGQAAMRGLPAWADLVGRFGLNTLGNDPLVAAIRDILLAPKPADFAPAYVAANPLLPVVLASPDASAALLPALLQPNGAIAAKLAGMPAPLRSSTQRLLNALEALRLQWAGEMVGNHDTQALGPNTAARIRMRFRTWAGPLVFHCHNVEHEDMRMMVNFEPTMSGKCSELNKHDPNIVPAARSHGQDVTDLLTNPQAVGEMPWEAIDGFPHYAWEQKPVPGTPVGEAGDPLIKPREPQR